MTSRSSSPGPTPSPSPSVGSSRLTRSWPASDASACALLAQTRPLYLCPELQKQDTRRPEGKAKSSTGQAEPEPIPLRWHGEVDPNADRAWLIRDLIPETGKGLLSGQWGTGKTFGALDLSASVMTGQLFAGRRVVRQGGVLFVAAEGAYEIPIRLQGLV